jgi:ATP adenylyltransferase
MDRLWSPWRSKYIGSFKETRKEKSDECFFCNSITQNEISIDTLMVHIGKHTVIMLNKYPYNNGHLLIAPKRHTGDITEINSDELNELMTHQVMAVKVLESIYKPQGFNIGANLGRAAGAGVPGHLHYHVLPRWNGDTNFMPIVADTKVFSQSFDESYQQIADGFRKFQI